MASDPTHPTTAASTERRPAVWPWLLLPLVTLAIFLALRTAKESPTPAAHETEAAQPGEDTESR